MRPEIGDVGSPQEWLRRAEADLALAGVALPLEGVYELLCFHAQQAAEKSIKAVLVNEGIDFPHTHNIQRLIDLLPEGICRTEPLLASPKLTVYAVSSRYPGVDEPVDEDEYRAVLKIARAVHDWALTHLRI